MGTSKKFRTSFNDALREDIQQYISGLKKMENGGNLHAMVVAITEKSLLEITLTETRGNQTIASHILGINRNTLRRKLGDHKLSASKFSHNGKK